MPKLIDLAWAAGLFEGEGSIAPTRKSRFPKAFLGSTDQDVVNRFCEVLGLGKVLGPYQIKNSKKLIWHWRANRFEEVQQVLCYLWPWLGRRRKARAIELLRAVRPIKTRASVVRNDEIYRRRLAGSTNKELAREYGLCRKHVANIVHTRRMRDLALAGY